MAKKAKAPIASNPKMKLKFVSRDIEVKDLLLDPNNYRFLDNPNHKKKLKNKYHLENVQESTLRLLEQDKRYQLSELKKSILANGYVPMERVIVVPYKHKADTYVVIEGNRRVAALKSLLQENQESVRELDASEVVSFSKIPCAILQTDERSLPHAERVIMGIRHIAGPKPWGAYQQAQLVLELHDNEGYDFKNIGDHLGISTVEVARRYRAMKALKTMEEDDLYSEKSEPDFYRLFHELVSLPDVRTRFGWDSNRETFTDIDRAREFFELIAPREDSGDAKLKTYSDVRKLKLIVGHSKAESVLLDPETSFGDALQALEEETKPVTTSMPFPEVLKEIIAKLEKTSLQDFRGLRRGELGLIDNIIGMLQQIKENSPNRNED